MVQSLSSLVLTKLFAEPPVRETNARNMTFYCYPCPICRRTSRWGRTPVGAQAILKQHLSDLHTVAQLQAFAATKGAGGTPPPPAPVMRSYRYRIVMEVVVEAGRESVARREAQKISDGIGEWLDENADEAVQYQPELVSTRYDEEEEA